MLGHRGSAARAAAAATSPASASTARAPGCVRVPRPHFAPLRSPSASATTTRPHKDRRAAGPILKASGQTTQAPPAKTAEQQQQQASAAAAPPPAADGAADAADAADAQATTTPTTRTPPSPLPTDLPPVAFDDVVLVQTFGWTSHKPQNGASFWRRLASQAPQIAALGATHAWLPPPSKSVSPEGYLPGQLFDMNSAYGSARELKDCCDALKAAGIRPEADIVINHRCADEQDERGEWTIYHDTRADETTIDEGDGRGGRATVDWGRWAITGDDPKFGGQGNPDSGADFEGAPDLDHHNPSLRRALVDWLMWLREDFGFESWRLDFAKGYAASYAGCYIARTLPAGYFCVGELWCDLGWQAGKPEKNQDAARQTICDWIDGCRAGGKQASQQDASSSSACAGDAAAFDFVTKGILQAALASGELWRLRDAAGKPPGVAGWWPQRAVLFVDNHDTGSSQAHWPCPPDCVPAAYAYILTHPGIPCLFSEHALDPPSDSPVRRAIEALLAARRAAGVSAGSCLSILKAEQDLYVADVQGRTKALRVKLGGAMEMGALLPREEDGWALAASGHGFAVWAKDGEAAASSSLAAR